MKYDIDYSKRALKDIEKHKKAGNKPLLKKLSKILLELETHPFEGEGKPEAMKYNFKGYWSRRLDDKNRIVYEVIETIVTVNVVSAKGHYDDK